MQTAASAKVPVAAVLAQEEAAVQRVVHLGIQGTARASAVAKTAKRVLWVAAAIAGPCGPPLGMAGSLSQGGGRCVSSAAESSK